MNALLVIAAALIVNRFQPVDGSVVIAEKPGRRVVAAYSARFENVWHHAYRESERDRIAEAGTGRVTGFDKDEELVVAFIDDGAKFDPMQPMAKDNAVFPYSAELEKTYRAERGSDYVKDMMVFHSPFLGGQNGRMRAMIGAFRIYDGPEGGIFAKPMKSFGGDDGRGRTLVIGGAYRSRCPGDCAYGNDGSGFAQALAEKGEAVDWVNSTSLKALGTDDNGNFRLNGRTYERLVLLHIDAVDAAEVRRVLAGNKVKAPVYAGDSPIINGARILFDTGDPAEITGR